MGSLNRRLEALEARARASVRADGGTTTSREVLSRMSVVELRRYVNALRRMKAGESPGDEDGPILQRVEELYEEVSNEL